MSWRRRMGAAIETHLSSRSRTAASLLDSGRQRSLRSGAKPLQSKGTSAASGSHKEHDRKDGQEHKEQNLRNSDRCARYAGKAEQSGNQTEDQKRKRPMQHGNLPLSVSLRKRPAAKDVPLTIKCRKCRTRRKNEVWRPSEKGDAARNKPISG